MDYPRDESDILVSEASTDPSLFAESCARTISHIVGHLKNRWTEAGASALEQTYHQHEGILERAYYLQQSQAWSVRTATPSSASAKSHAITSKPGGRVDKSSRFAPKASRARKRSWLSEKLNSLETQIEHEIEGGNKSDVDYEQTMDAAKGMILFRAYKQRQQPSSAINFNRSRSFDMNLDTYQNHAAEDQIPEELEWERLKEACFAAFRYPFISKGTFFAFCEQLVRYPEGEDLEKKLASLGLKD